MKKFVITDHAVEQFNSRFGFMLRDFDGDTEKALNNQLRNSRKYSSTSKAFQAFKVKQLMNHSYEPAVYRVTPYVVFVIVNNTVKTVYKREGSIFDSEKSLELREQDRYHRKRQRRLDKKERKRSRKMEREYGLFV